MCRDRLSVDSRQRLNRIREPNAIANHRMNQHEPPPPPHRVDIIAIRVVAVQCSYLAPIGLSTS